MYAWSSPKHMKSEHCLGLHIFPTVDVQPGDLPYPQHASEYSQHVSGGTSPPYRIFPRRLDVIKYDSKLQVIHAYVSQPDRTSL